MDEGKKGTLQRLDVESKLPIGFDQLSNLDQLALIQKMAENDIELRKRLMEKAGSSRLAEHDLSVFVDTVKQLESERKIYTARTEGSTGSGTYEMKIRGGDTKFIVPILIVIGVFILGVVLILALV